MAKLQLIIHWISILAFIAMQCSAGKPNKGTQLSGKRDCIPLGGRCETADDCCGIDDPDSGHCVRCWRHGGYLIQWGHQRCTCENTGSATIDPDTHVITSNKCDGHDATRSRCVTRVAPPGDRYYRGKKLFWYVHKDCTSTINHEQTTVFSDSVPEILSFQFIIRDIA